MLEDSKKHFWKLSRGMSLLPERVNWPDDDFGDDTFKIVIGALKKNYSDELHLQNLNDYPLGTILDYSLAVKNERELFKKRIGLTVKYNNEIRILTAEYEKRLSKSSETQKIVSLIFEYDPCRIYNESTGNAVAFPGNQQHQTIIVRSLFLPENKKEAWLDATSPGISDSLSAKQLYFAAKKLNTKLRDKLGLMEDFVVNDHRNKRIRLNTEAESYTVRQEPEKT
jgi:hypothetical protein